MKMLEEYAERSGGILRNVGVCRSVFLPQSGRGSGYPLRQFP